MNQWLGPAVAYVLLTGALGITSKLALRHIGWMELVIWGAIAYAVFSLLLIVSGARLHIGVGAVFAASSGAIAASSLALYVMTVSHGEVSRTVPFMSSFPLVSIILGVLVLSERISGVQLVGAALVLAGVFLLTRA